MFTGPFIPSPGVLTLSAHLFGSRWMKQTARFPGKVGFHIPCGLSDPASSLPAAPKGASATGGIFYDRVMSS